MLLGAFVVQERRAQEPVLPLRLFKEPVFNIVSAALFLTTLSFFTVIVFMPVFLQTVTGVSATESGVLLLALLITGTVSTIVSGRRSPRPAATSASRCSGWRSWPPACSRSRRIDADTSKATIAALLAFFGVGFGLVSQVLTVAIQNAVDRRDLGIATASANLFRSLGGAIGVATFGALYSGASIFLYAAPVAIAALLVVTVAGRGAAAREAVAAHELHPEGAAAQRAVRRPRRAVRERRAAHWAGPPLHHHDFDEAFYVLEGELVFQVEDA